MTNIVLITVDCLRRDHCGHNGYSKDTTPNIDSLCPDSYVFRSAQAPGPRTAESVPGILSGRLSSECGFIEELSFKTIPDGAETLASFAAGHNYKTLATVSNPQLSPIRNFDKGFDVFENLRIKDQGDRFETIGDTQEGGDSGEKGTPLIHSVGKRFLDIGQSLPLNPANLALALYRQKQLQVGWPTVDGERVVNRFLDQLPDDGPFFAWTHLNDIHAPIHPQRAREGGLISATNTRQFLADAKRVNHEQTALYDLMYDSTVRYVDAQIGRILTHLEKQGIRDETAIIITADHGEALYDRGLYEHAAGNGQRLYESDRDYLYRELLDVPLIVDIPGEQGGEIMTPFSLTWLHQILADIIGVEEGGFPQSATYSGRIFDTDSIVLADAITENGHTIAATDSDIKTITDGTDLNSIDPNNWHLLSRRDQSDRMRAGTLPKELEDAVREQITDPNSLQQSNSEIHEETMEQLADLGYR